MADIKSETITGGRPGSGAHRVVALCGPYLSGKTSLLESILYATGAIGRRGSTRAGTSIGDGAAEARKRGMGTEINVATVDYLGDQWTFLDVPGSIEFHLYHNINLNDDREAAWEESKRFLDTYYAMDFPSERVRSWTAAGSADECVRHLRVFEAMGFHEVTLRITGWDQMGQLDRVMRDVLPRLLH
jgi:alkanesulfonate monooxygenase SsuD/methylene tetrahydromethanopterin reductase-like flavin-dependent oxidoreductase (luciferase family)